MESPRDFKIDPKSAQEGKKMICEGSLEESWNRPSKNHVFGCVLGEADVAEVCK